VVASEHDTRPGRAVAALRNLFRRAVPPPRESRPDLTLPAVVVQLTHRSQRLSARVISRIDRLEQGEEDPDRLAELFELDHLITRMRRNEEDLLVLAGAASVRVRTEPVALIDVLRAAQSEIEHYTRVGFGEVERDVLVAAPAVTDLVHLVAELLDNATAFSPSDVVVVVEARRTDDGLMLTVEDAGPGLSAAELADLNARLADPGRFDPDSAQALGLAVVARLAARHHLRVELRPADSGAGTLAEVALPATLLEAAGTSAPRRTPVPAFRRQPAEPPVPLDERVRAVVAAVTKTPVGELATNADGDLGIPAGSATVFVRMRDDPTLVEAYAPVLAGLEPSEALYARLLEINARLPIGRVSFTDGTVRAAVAVFGRDFQPTHLRLALQVMTGLASDLGDRLHEEFGGTRP
jgi:anti-sigma regulatory factor (Ser/Thr protein kinase)